MTSHGGLYWFRLVEDYSAWHGFIFLAFFMLAGIWFTYSFIIPKTMKKSVGRFERDVAMMIGPPKTAFRKAMHWYLRFMLTIGTPVLLLFVLIYAFINYAHPAVSYGYKEGKFQETTDLVI